jgi:EAL domain-containing protein (putative c-di-GMP-specific phosphodiesterase class I)
VAALEIVTSDGSACSVTLSIGVAVAPKDGETPEALLQAAEYAVRSVKGRGGGQIAFYDPQWGERIRARTALALRMEHALAANEFALFLQPVVRSDGALVAAEALIRWLPPEQPPISPAEFIPLAEESGFIRRLGLWVFEEALRLAEQLRQTGWGTPQIAVNVSPLQLEDEGFLQHVHRALEQWRAVAEGAPFPLTLELTESAAMERFEQLKVKFEYLARAEVPFAIDDFGTGHSSLGRLRELPFAKLKIDRSFVVRLFDSPRDEALVASIIRIAHAFGVKVVAEGVEEARFVARLSELGCDEFQGYYFAKPMPADAFVAWMKDHLR